MKRSQVDQELTAFRMGLADFASRIADGDAPSYEEVREAADQLACLLDETPAVRWAEVEYLIDCYEALMARLLN